MRCMACGADDLVKIVGGRDQVGRCEFSVPRYRTTLRFPLTAKESDAETAAPVMLAPVVPVSTIENLRTAAKSLLRPMLAKVPFLFEYRGAEPRG